MSKGLTFPRAVLLSAAIVTSTALFVQAQQRGGFGGGAANSKIQAKSYVFKEANDKNQTYALFVPSTYDKDKKSPLIVALHGLGGNPNQILGTRGFTDLAEKNGYIVVAPYGYNESSWYGAGGPSGMGGGRGGAKGGAAKTPAPAETAKAAPAQTPAATPAATDAAKVAPAQTPAATPATPAATPAAQTPAATDAAKAAPAQTPAQTPGRGGRGGGRGGIGGGRGGIGGGLLGGGGGAVAGGLTAGQLGEKDVFNVLEIVRKEYNIDPDRIYLMGHSMGGGGTLYLGPKYPDIWAGMAPFAPAIYSTPNALSSVKGVPLLIVQGDRDALVPVTGTRNWVNKAKELGMTLEYVEVANGDHMSVVAPNLPKMFEFFNKYTKADQKKDAKPEDKK